MYKAGLVVAVAVEPDNKIVREVFKDGTSTVYLPFGSEYSLVFKNQENQSASVSVSVDGIDALAGRSLVVPEKSSVSLKGFLDESHSIVKNAFKFIEKTDKIVNYRGNKIDDGIIRIEFQFEKRFAKNQDESLQKLFKELEKERRNREKIYPFVPNPAPDPSYPVGPFPERWPYTPKTPWTPSRPWPDTGPICPIAQPIWYCANTYSNSNQSVASNKTKCLVQPDKSKKDHNEDGITVAGSPINQSFVTKTLSALESEKYVIAFQIKGEKGNGEKLKDPLLSLGKITCKTCGTKSRTDIKFCGECGTCLI